jgi:hypothetical protein
MNQLSVSFFTSVTKSKYFDFFLALVLFFAALIYYKLSILAPDILMAPNTYQARDLKRAIELYLEHKFIWHGPELSGGGYSPGPFYYVLIGLPFFLTGSLMSVYWFEYILAALAVTVAWFFLKRKYSTLSANVFYLIFLSSGYFRLQLLSFMNPAFQYVFLISAMICFLKKEKAYLIAGGLFLGLALQLHYASVTVFFAVLFALFRDSSLNKTQKKHLILTVMASTALPVSFYFCYKLFFADYVPYLWSLNPLLRPLHAILRVHELVSADSFENFLRFFLKEFYIIPAVILIYKNFQKKTYEADLFAAVFVLSGVLLPTLAIAMFNARYVAPFVVACALYFSIWISRIGVKRSQLAVLVMSCGMIFANFTDIWPYANREEFFLGSQSFAKVESLTKSILSNTGWTPDYFREHSYLYGLIQTDNFTFIYSYLFLKEQAHAGERSSEKYDGLWAIPPGIISPDHFTELSHTKPVLKFLPLTLYSALISGEIECKKFEFINDYQICYYKFKDAQKTRRLGNLGMAYDYHDNIPSGPYKPAAGTYSMNENEAVVYDNQCGYLHPHCFTYYHLKILPPATLKLEIEGAPFSAFDPYDFPGWIQGFKFLRVAVNCNEQTSEFSVPSGLGFADARDNFSAPFDEYFELPCKNPKSIGIEIDTTINFFVIKNSGNAIKFGKFKGAWVRR